MDGYRELLGDGLMAGSLSITGSPIVVKDEGTSQGSVTSLDFVGSAVSVAVSGADATITVSSSTNQAQVLKLVSFRG